MTYSQDEDRKPPTISRREFIQAGVAFIGVAAVGASGCSKPLMDKENKITIGMFTDAHYADRAMRINRYYRESAAKVEQAIAEFNSTKPDFIIQLGDFVDKGESVETELSYLERIEREYAKFAGERHYVLGNHDVAMFSKEQFISNCGARENHYSFDKGNFHNIVLDACYNKDKSDYKAGNFDWTQSYIPAWEQEWLKADLQMTEKRVIVFLHQRLDDEDDPHGVKKAPEVREILEESGKVLAVFQGHDHSGAYNSINNIHYYTLPALVAGSGPENNAYAVAQIRIDGSININGFGKLKGPELPQL
ncbi:metallophosphoesterase [Candidatus Poribacteria bacterium]